MDGGDLDVVSRTEREDENRFVVECDATGKIAVQPRLCETEILVEHASMRRRRNLDVREPRRSLESRSIGRSRTEAQHMITSRDDKMHDVPVSGCSQVISQ